MQNLDALIAQQKKLMGTDAAGAKAGKEIGMSLAGEKNATLRAIAQGVAENLAAGGAPVTMDMVMAFLLQQGLVKPDTAKQPPRNWAGTVFKKGLWVCVGSMPSTRLRNKERHVRAWVLKRFMGTRNANGTKMGDSASNITEMFHQARKAGWKLEDAEWLVGDHRTSEEYVAMAKSGTMMGSKATLVPETIGVMLRRFKQPSDQNWPPDLVT